MLSRSLKIKQARLSHSHYRHSRLSDAGARLSESSCRGNLLLPPFSPKRVQMLPISLKRDPFFSLKYSARLSEMLASAHLAQARGFLWDEEMLSRSSETEVAWARLRGYICFGGAELKAAWNFGREEVRAAELIPGASVSHFLLLLLSS